MFQSPGRKGLFQREKPVRACDLEQPLITHTHTPSTCPSNEFTHSSALDALAGQETDMYMIHLSSDTLVLFWGRNNLISMDDYRHRLHSKKGWPIWTQFWVKYAPL